MCYCGLKSSKRICKYTLITPLLAYIFVKRNVTRGVWLLCIFFCNNKYQGGTFKFIYKALVIGNKQLLSNMIDRKSTQVPCTTRIALLADSYCIYVFCSNYPAILYIIAIASRAVARSSQLVRPDSTLSNM